MKKVCKHKGCDSAPAFGRNECYKCRSRGIMARKPIDMCFYFLKKSAKKRGLEFSIELKWFKDWVLKSDYMERRGRSAESLGIDRIKNELGYTMTNIQILTKSENSAKYWAEFRENLINNNYAVPGEIIVHPF